MTKPSEALNHLQISDKSDDLSFDQLKKMYDRICALGRIGVWECELATESLSWTDSVYDLFDMPRRSLVSRAATLEIYEPNSRREMERLRSHAIATCSNFTVDVAIRTKKGNSRWIRITGDVEQEDGHAVKIFGTKQDITSEKLAQLEVQALQTEIIHSSRISAIGSLTSTLANELNQPLASIALYVASIEKILATTLKPTLLRSALHGLNTSALEASQILRRMRKFAQNNSSRAVHFGLNDTIRSACEIAFVSSPENIVLSYAVPEDLIVVGDPIQIQHVIVNVLRNFRDLSSESSRPEVAISAERINAFVEITISDLHGSFGHKTGTVGSGISGPEVFDGSGFGLSISEAIIEAHSGKFSAFKNATGASGIRFSLPFAD